MNFTPYPMPEQVSEPMYSREEKREVLPVFMPEYIKTPVEDYTEPTPVMPEYMKRPMPEPVYRAETYMPEPMAMPEPVVPKTMPVIEPPRGLDLRPEPERRHEHKPERKPMKDFYPLWKRRMMYMQTLVTSIVEGLSDVQACSRRVSSCNADIADYLKPCFGKDGIKDMSELLNNDLVYTVQTAQAVKNGNKKNAADSWERVTHNTKQMMDTLKKGDHDIDCDKLGDDYMEYQEMLKDEMMYKSKKKY